MQLHFTTKTEKPARQPLPHQSYLTAVPSNGVLESNGYSKRRSTVQADNKSPEQFTARILTKQIVRNESAHTSLLRN